MDGSKRHQLRVDIIRLHEITSDFISIGLILDYTRFSTDDTRYTQHNSSQAHPVDLAPKKVLAHAGAGMGPFRDEHPSPKWL